MTNKKIESRDDYFDRMSEQSRRSPLAVIRNGVVVDETGTSYYKNDTLHRLDGPAVIRKNGDQYWMKGGYLHREDGPAIICEDGYQCWYFEGKKHRLGGPAVQKADGTQEWWVNGDVVEPDECSPLGYRNRTIEGFLAAMEDIRMNGANCSRKFKP